MNQDKPHLMLFQWAWIGGKGYQTGSNEKTTTNTFTQSKNEIKLLWVQTNTKKDSE